MRISVFGLGYVGTVSAGCLANDGREIGGVDLSTTKMDLINGRSSAIIEAEIGEIIQRNVREGASARRAGLEGRQSGERVIIHLRRHSKPLQRQPGLELIRRVVRGDWFGPEV